MHIAVPMATVGVKGLVDMIQGRSTLSRPTWRKESVLNGGRPDRVKRWPVDDADPDGVTSSWFESLDELLVQSRVGCVHSETDAWPLQPTTDLYQSLPHSEQPRTLRVTASSLHYWILKTDQKIKHDNGNQVVQTNRISPDTIRKQTRDESEEQSKIKQNKKLTKLLGLHVMMWTSKITHSVRSNTRPRLRASFSFLQLNDT